MEEKSLILEKIDSKYIYQILFSYLKDENFKLNLFKYSKSFQKKLGIQLSDYQKEYLSNQDINLKSYFSFKNDFNNIENKNILTKNLNDDLQKFKVDFNLLEEYAINSYKNKKDEDRIKIDIYSPFYESLIKKYNKNYEIVIPVNTIEKFGLKNDYITSIEKLNKLELNMNRICINFQFQNPNDINYLSDLKINFKLIKMLKLRQKNKEKNEKKEIEEENENEIREEIITLENQSFDNFYKVLFNLPDIQNVLIDLDIKNKTKDKNIPNSFELINNLKVLQNLTITGYKFTNIFTLRLYDLQKLKLINVENFALDDTSPFNLNYLYISSCEMVKSKSAINIPKLENFYYIDSYNLYINYQDFKFLKIMGINSSNFIKITEIDLSSLTSLEEIEIFSCTKSVRIETIKNLLLIKNLKIAELHMKNLNKEEIEEIEGENLSLTTLKLLEIEEECITYELQRLFPNLNSIFIHSYYTVEDLRNHWCLNCRQAGYTIYPTDIEIKENRDCKVDKITFYGQGSKNIELYCQSYESLKEIIIKLENRIWQFTFPILNDKPNIIFKSLVNFTFVNVSDSRNIRMSSDFIQNLYNNIENMPNLKIFILLCNFWNVKKEFYTQFIRKLLSLNLDKIILSFIPDLSCVKKYSRQELKEIYPNINHLNFKNISIYKLD